MHPTDTYIMAPICLVNSDLWLSKFIVCIWMHTKQFVVNAFKAILEIEKIPQIITINVYSGTPLKGHP